MENINIESIKSVICKLPHSPGRVPYTYHHDFIRTHVDKFNSFSRSDITQIHVENEFELYCVALYVIINKVNWLDILELKLLNDDDLLVCWQVRDIVYTIIHRYDQQSI